MEQRSMSSEEVQAGIPIMNDVPDSSLNGIIVTEVEFLHIGQYGHAIFWTQPRQGGWKCF